MEKNKVDWENLSNSSIKMNLESLLHEQISLRDRILKLSEKPCNLAASLGVNFLGFLFFCSIKISEPSV